VKKKEDEIRYSVERTKPFAKILHNERVTHNKLVTLDLPWLEGRLVLAPDKMGDRLCGLKNLNLPVYKTRLKDSCCNLSASAGWRVYYAVSNKTENVYLVFLHHKKDLENPAKDYLQQKIQNAFAEGV
jgi:hypothetical protein